jgi:hypothetical protein
MKVTIKVYLLYKRHYKSIFAQYGHLKEDVSTITMKVTTKVYYYIYTVTYFEYVYSAYVIKLSIFTAYVIKLSIFTAYVIKLSIFTAYVIKSMITVKSL